MSNTFATVIFGLAASLFWGSGDFCGGLASRRNNASTVVTAAYAVGFVLLVALAFIWKEPFPSTLDIGWGGLAGLVGAIGLVLFYSALSIGRMGIIAPVSAILTAGLPVIFSAFTEGAPSLLQTWRLCLSLNCDSAHIASRTIKRASSGHPAGIAGWLWVWLLLHSYQPYKPY